MKRIRTNSTTKLLLEAAERGNSAIVYSLLKTVASVNDTDGQQNTPLLLAAARGHTKVVQIIINHGHNKKKVNLTMNNLAGNTALHVACENGHLAIVKLLLDCSDFIRDINAQNTNGDTALHLAAHQGNIDIVQQMLLVETIDCNIKNYKAQSAARKARLQGNTSVYELIKKNQNKKCIIM